MSLNQLYMFKEFIMKVARFKTLKKLISYTWLHNFNYLAIYTCLFEETKYLQNEVKGGHT